MKLIKGSILNKIQVAAEVNGALTGHNLVVVTKTGQDGANPVYAIYAGHGEIVDGALHEVDDPDGDSREEKVKQ